jgi:L-fuconolactonase
MARRFLTLLKMIIDSHQHFWRYDPLRDTWITDEMSVLKRNFLLHEFAAERGPNQIDASIAVQTDQSESETLFLLNLAEHNQHVAGVVGWVDLSSRNVESRLQHFSQFPKLCGLRHIVQSEPDDRFLMQPDFFRGVSLLEQFDLTYDILIYPKQLPAAIELVARRPEQPFVLDHAAKPCIKSAVREPWASHVKTLAQNPNVFCKLSGLVTEADWREWQPLHFRPYLDVLFESFGPDRLMFGSDWPVCLLAASYAQVKQLIADYVESNAPQHKEKIFGGNAARFYGLEAAHHGLAA